MARTDNHEPIEALVAESNKDKAIIDALVAALEPLAEEGRQLGRFALKMHRDAIAALAQARKGGG